MGIADKSREKMTRRVDRVCKPAFLLSSSASTSFDRQLVFSSLVSRFFQSILL